MASAKNILADLFATHPNGLWAQEGLEAFLDDRGVGAGDALPNPGTVYSEPEFQKDLETAKRVWARVTLDHLVGVRVQRYDAQDVGVPSAEVEELRELVVEFHNAWSYEYGDLPHSHGKEPQPPG